MKVSDQTNWGMRKAGRQVENTSPSLCPVETWKPRASGIRQKRLNDPLDNIAAAGLNGD